MESRVRLETAVAMRIIAAAVAASSSSSRRGTRARSHRPGSSRLALSPHLDSRSLQSWLVLMVYPPYSLLVQGLTRQCQPHQRQHLLTAPQQQQQPVTLQQQ